MKALLLIGGQATRLYPLSRTVAKSLLPVCDREVLHYQITQLAMAGISEIILAAGHHVEQLEEFVSGYGGGLHFHISVEHEMLGTAGAIANAHEYIEGDSVLVLNADIMSSLYLANVMQKHREAGRQATIVGYSLKDPSRYGLLEVDGDAILGFREKPEAVLDQGPFYVNAGVYVLEPEALQQIPWGRAVSIERETFPLLIQQHGALTLYPFDGLWVDVGTFESYFKANFELLMRRYSQGEDWLWGERDDCHVFRDQIYLHNTVRLGKGADLFHRVILMKGVSVGENCHMRNVIALPGSSIDANCNIEDAIIGPGVGVAEGRVIRSALLVQGEPDSPFYPESLAI